MAKSAEGGPRPADGGCGALRGLHKPNLFSTRLSHFAPGDAAYVPGDELELCYAAHRPDLASAAPEDLAQTIYGELNPGDSDRPHSLLFPSLSVGDVVSYRDADREGSLSVELVGFSPIDPPVFAFADAVAAYRRKVSGPPNPERSGVPAGTPLLKSHNTLR